MKIIIVEGTDRTGKDTLINELKDLSNHTLIIHCTKAVGNTVQEQNVNQDLLFLKYVKNIDEHKYDNLCDLIIFNRAWYGEYVYGPMYRNRDKHEVASLILGYETSLMIHGAQDIYYIQLINDSYNLVMKNDDGDSISNKEKDFNEEIKLFKEIFEKSSIYKKKLIYVNDGDDFREKEEILNEVLNFVNE